MRRVALALSLLWLTVAAHGAAGAESTIRYHYGDDSRWADPAYDDSAWPIAAEGRVPQPPFASDGFVWIRARVAVPGVVPGPLTLRSGASRSGPDVQQFFIEGAAVGDFGQFPPNATARMLPQQVAIDLPSTIAKPGQTLMIALRGWNRPADRSPRGPIIAEFSVDASALQHAVVQQTRAETLLRYAPVFAMDAVLELLGIGILVLGLWSRRRDLFLYALWLVTMPVFLAAISLRSTAVGLRQVPFEVMFLFINAFGMCVVTEFLWTVQGFRNDLSRRLTHLCWIVENAAAIYLAVSSQPGDMVAAARFLDIWLLFLFNVIQTLANLWALCISGRNRAIAAAMLLINFGYYLRWSGHSISFGTLPITFFEAAFYLSSFVIAALLIHQAWASWKKGDDLRIEFAAARELQQQLVPLALPAIAGLRLEAAYLPAKDVGGDFYQVLEEAGGSTLILVGDVSGKGLKAAMTGILTIGAASALAAEAPGPALLLTRLNREMTRFQKGGFVTCLCARIGPGGVLTVANAGHLAPYINGVEMVLDNGLPLGLSSDATYSESTFQLEANQQLTILTDGVLEARDGAGELYGFDRTAAISTQSAERIAAAAHAFGQDDDITVLTVAYVV
jgi:hypothetical protein